MKIESDGDDNNVDIEIHIITGGFDEPLDDDDQWNLSNVLKNFFWFLMDWLVTLFEFGVVIVFWMFCMVWLFG